MASSSPFQAPNPNVEHWFNRVIHHHCSSTSSSASSTSSYPGGRSQHSTNSASNSATAATVLADVMAHTQLGQYPNSFYCFIPFLHTLHYIWTRGHKLCNLHTVLELSSNILYVTIPHIHSSPHLTYLVYYNICSPYVLQS